MHDFAYSFFSQANGIANEGIFWRHLGVSAKFSDDAERELDQQADEESQLGSESESEGAEDRY